MMKTAFYRITIAMIYIFCGFLLILEILMFMNSTLFTNNVYSGSGLWPILSILIMVLSSILAALVQSAGFFLIGAILGHQCFEIGLGLFRWERWRGTWKFHVRKDGKFGIGCSMLPQDKTYSFVQYILKNLGGDWLISLFSLILFIIFISAENLSILSREFLLLVALVFQVIALMDMLPRKLNEQRWTNGRLVWDGLQRPDVVYGITDNNYALKQFVTGARPREFDIRTEPEVLQDYPFSDTFTRMKYFQALDMKDFSSANRYVDFMEQHLDRIQKVQPANLSVFQYELCYSGCIRQDRDMAAKYYGIVSDELKKDDDLNGCRIKAYYAYFIEKDAAKALDFCQKALEVANNFPNRSQAFIEIDLVNELKTKIENDKDTALNRDEA
jgi:hypothetical protein